MCFFEIILLIYVVVLGFMVFSLKRIPPNKISSKQPIKKFSILIAFRNEEANLSSLIESLKQLDYPEHLYEIRFINDHSSDASLSVLQHFIKETPNVYLQHLNQNETGKKKAIEKGIQQAKYDYILTTDADCSVPQKWLYSYNQKLIHEDADAMIGSIGIVKEKDFLSYFQYYDFLALQAVGFAFAQFKKPILCNGANFCYTKEAFLKVNGFQGNEQHPSGDDIFLLQKFVKNNLKISLLVCKNNLVLTKPIPLFSAFIQQRKRWFYKTRFSASLLQQSLAILLLLINLSLVFLLFLLLFNTTYLTIFIVIILSKVMIDFFLTFEMAKKLNMPFCFTDFAIANLLYPISLVIFLGFLLNSKMQWKERVY